MGDKGHRNKLGIVVPAFKGAKVSREAQLPWAVADEVCDGIRRPEVIFDRVMGVVGALVRVILRSRPLKAGEHLGADREAVSCNYHRAARPQTQGPATVSSLT